MHTASAIIFRISCFSEATGFRELLKEKERNDDVEDK